MSSIGGLVHSINDCINRRNSESRRCLSVRAHSAFSVKDSTYLCSWMLDTPSWTRLDAMQVHA